MIVRAMCMAALVAVLNLGTACRDTGGDNALTGPEPWVPRFDHTNPPDYYQYCRMWNTGVTQRNVGGFWVGPCATTVTAVPKVYFSNQDTQPITFTFSSTVFDLDFGAAYNICTMTTPMTWATFDAAGNPVESGTWERPASCDTNPNSGSAGGFILAPFKSLRVTPPAPMPPNAPDGRAITFMFDFFTICPPTSDPILDDPGIRKQLRDELTRSRPRADGVGKKEYGGYVYRRDDGTYFLHPANDLTATDCGFTIPAGSPPSLPGATYAGRFYHTHPSYHGDRVYGCSWAKPTDIVTVDRDPKHGGGSPEDWKTVDDIWTPGYIIDLDLKVYRLDPGTPRSQRGSHPNKWRYDGKCLIRFS